MTCCKELKPLKRKRVWFKVVVYVMIASMLFSTLMFALEAIVQ